MIDTPRRRAALQPPNRRSQTSSRLIPHWNLALGSRLTPRWTRLYRRSPDPITSDEVQRYLLHLLRERKLSRSSVNQAGCALRSAARSSSIALGIG